MLLLRIYRTLCRHHMSTNLFDVAGMPSFLLPLLQMEDKFQSDMDRVLGQSGSGSDSGTPKTEASDPKPITSVEESEDPLSTNNPSGVEGGDGNPNPISAVIESEDLSFKDKVSGSKGGDPNPIAFVEESEDLSFLDNASESDWGAGLV